MVFQEEAIGEEIKPDRLAKIVGVGDDEVEFQIGDTIYVLRRPNTDDNIVIGNNDRHKQK